MTAGVPRRHPLLSGFASTPPRRSALRIALAHTESKQQDIQDLTAGRLILVIAIIQAAIVGFGITGFQRAAVGGSALG